MVLNTLVELHHLMQNPVASSYCCSVTGSYTILCDPMGCIVPGCPVLHRLPGFAQIHVHRVADAVQLPPLQSPPFSFCLQSGSGSFLMSLLFPAGGQGIGPAASTSVLLMNIQGWFPLGLTGLISLLSKGLSRIFSNTTIQRHHSLALSLYGPTLTSIHDYWKNHSFDNMEPCLQSDVSAF